MDKEEAKQTIAEVQNMIDLTVAEMLQFNIHLTNDCTNEINIAEINNQQLYNVNSLADLCYFKDFYDETYLNIFVLDFSTVDASGFFGLASTPGNLCLVRNVNSQSYKALIHELGHCFGLWHTSHGRPYDFKVNGVDWECNNNNGITSNTIPVPTCQESSNDPSFFYKTIEFELVDGSNSATSGDFVSDTPADISITDGNCNQTETGIMATCDNDVVDCDALNDNRKKDPNCDKYEPDWTNYMRPVTNKDL